MACYYRPRTRRRKLNAKHLADLVATTIRDLGPVNFTEIATDLQPHVAMTELLMKYREESPPLVNER